MMFAKRFLVTTAEERSWKLDQPVLFLGEWCRRYDRKHVWSTMDAVVAEPYGLSSGQRVQNIVYVQSLTSQLLKELADALNMFHGTCHSLRYWEIVLGHWLQRYVAVVFNRYFTIKQALEKHELAGTIVFESKTYHLATTDSTTFIWACNDDIWNHVLFSKILRYQGYVTLKSDPETLRGVRGFTMGGESRPIRRAGIKHSMLNAAVSFLPNLCRQKDAFIINSFLPLKEEIKLQLSLRQCPQFWRSPALETVAPDPEKRRGFALNAENHQDFERFVRLCLGEIMPTCYLEGYGQLVNQIDSLRWPKKPRFIFTSNNFDTDEIFKGWVGKKVEEGCSYFTGQHGNNYGTHIYLGNQYWPDLAASDKFITWGWTNGSDRNVPAFAFITAGRKSQRRDLNGGLLLIELHPPHRFGPEDSFVEFGIYQEEQFRFVAALPESIQQKLTVRLHCSFSDFHWSDEQRWKERSPNTRIESGAAPIQGLIAGSRLIVHSYDSTGILETLSLNIPTICFWYGGFGHLLASARPYYQVLKDAGIIADTPEQAADFVASNWDNIDAWWGSKKVQDARKIFCDKYARTEKKPVRALKRLLTAHAKQWSFT